MNLWRVAVLVFCVGGIYGAYITQGYVSEDLSTRKYGVERESFVHLEALNGAQSLTCFIWAWLLFQAWCLCYGTPKALPPTHVYWKAGLTNTIGPACGMIALKNISYPAQVLAKSCKMVPVMVVGTVLHGKRYTLLEYACMALVGIGMGLFAKRSSGKVTSKLAKPNAPWGYTLCAINLVFDGYTNTAQDEVNRQYPGNNSIHMMCWMNFWTFFYYGVYLSFGPALLNSGRALLASSGVDPALVSLSGTTPNIGWELVDFCTRHNDAAWDVFLFCTCGAVGQLFIFFTITSFGSLVNTLACTTRKFFSVLISVFLNKNALLPSQWGGVFMVFTGLIGSTVVKSVRPGRHKPHQH